MQKGQVIIFLLVGILVITAVGGAYYLYKSTSLKPSTTPTIASQTPRPPLTPFSSDTNPPLTGSIETANWKTYTNQQAGYSFKYPLEWISEEQQLSLSKSPEPTPSRLLYQSTPSFSIGPADNLRHKPPTFISVVVLDDPQNTPVKTLVAELTGLTSGVTYETINVSSIISERVHLPGNTDMVIVKRALKAYIISDVNGSGQIPSTIFDRILSTFRFIDFR